MAVLKILKTFCQDQDQDQDFTVCPRGASRQRLWSRGLHHWSSSSEICTGSDSLPPRRWSRAWQKVTAADLSLACWLAACLPVETAITCVPNPRSKRTFTSSRSVRKCCYTESLLCQFLACLIHLSLGPTPLENSSNIFSTFYSFIHFCISVLSYVCTRFYLLLCETN